MNRIDLPVSKMTVLPLRLRSGTHRVRLPRPGGPCSSRPRLRCWQALEQVLRPLGDADDVPLDGLQHAVRQDHVLSRDLRPGQERDQFVAVCSLALKLSTWPRNTSLTRISRSISSRAAMAAARSAASISRLEKTGPNWLSSRIPITTGVPSGAVASTRPKSPPRSFRRARSGGPVVGRPDSVVPRRCAHGADRPGPGTADPGRRARAS